MCNVAVCTMERRCKLTFFCISRTALSWLLLFLDERRMFARIFMSMVNMKLAGKQNRSTTSSRWSSSHFIKRDFMAFGSMAAKKRHTIIITTVLTTYSSCIHVVSSTNAERGTARYGIYNSSGLFFPRCCKRSLKLKKYPNFNREGGTTSLISSMYDFGRA